MFKKLVWIAILLFIATNGLLVLLDHEGKVNRTAYITEWEAVDEKDLYEKIGTSGVVAYTEEHYIYFDDSAGSFQAFLVEEGSTINTGDPLYSYRVDSYFETENLLQNELATLNGEISAIEDAITEMASYQIPKPSEPVIRSDDEDNQSVTVVEQSDPIEAELLKEQYLIEKESELSAKKDQAKSIQSQLEDLHTTGDTVTVESPYEGKIKAVSTTLDDPVIIIEDTRLQVKGELEEADRKLVEPGLEVEIEIADLDKDFKGIIKSVGDSPVNEVTVNQGSNYPFEVSFDEEEALDAVLPGYHTDLEIIQNQSLQAATVNKNLVFNNHVWKLTDEGKVEKELIETGIEMGNDVELTSGINPGDFLLTENINVDYAGAPFIAPFNYRKAPWLNLVDGKQWTEFFVTGIISR
ncbi:HlyD family secretion protein [Oceanobacillus limi]|uniref:HlyD family secretion protein n=1 Tax=Oceanobacillus limi TaxID=930131 RepID=A0A1I0HLS8_9BACI|nr:efflux RND transporter periplasmic adaptor subunit [Oceanobacillus limi]SET84703.1 HlyD family secretion protein [Oceanobacillus limi]